MKWVVYFQPVEAPYFPFRFYFGGDLVHDGLVGYLLLVGLFVVFLYSGWCVVLSAGDVQWCFLLKENLCKVCSMLPINRFDLICGVLDWLFSVCRLIYNRFWGKSSIGKLYYSMFILLQMGPIGAGDEPFKNGSRDNLWEKERLCKQIMNPYRHSSEVKLCQLAVMGSSFVKRSGSMSSTHTRSLWLRSEVSHYSQTEGLTGDTGQQRWASQTTPGTSGEFTAGSTSAHTPLHWSAVKKPTTLARNQRLQTHGQTSFSPVSPKAVGSLY